MYEPRTIAEMLLHMRPIGGGSDDPDPDPDDKDPDPPEGNDPDPDPDPEPFDEERAKAKIAKANSEAKNLRDRLKAAEAKVKEFEDKDKTEAEKAADRAAELERKAQEAELRALRLEVAADKGLTPAQARRLVGSTKEELEADAEELLETFKPREGDDSGKKPPAGRPKERLRGGGDPNNAPEETDPVKLAAKVPRF